MSPRFQKQTRRGGPDAPPEERGDCVPACIASVLGVPLADVGNHHHAAPDWFASLDETCARFGYTIAILDLELAPPSCYWIAAVPSKNLASAECKECGGCGCRGCDWDGVRTPWHSIVMRGELVAWDPSIGRHQYEPGEAISCPTICEGWVLVELDPAAGSKAEP